MKILLVYPYFAPAWSYGGVTRVVYEIAVHLVKQGNDVTVFTTDAFDMKSRLTVSQNPTLIDGVTTYYFRNLSNYFCSRYHIPIAIERYRVIKKSIDTYDIIHLHGYSHFLNVITAHYANKAGIPYILHAHGGLAETLRGNYIHLLFSKIFGKKLLTNSKRVIALNATEKEQYIQMGVDVNKIIIKPTVINNKDFQILPSKGGFRKKYHLDEKLKIILYVGRMHKTKSIDVLLKSYAKLCRKVEHSKLVLLGPDDGGYQLYLSNIAQKLGIRHKIIFTGFVTNEEKIEAYIDSDVFVTPSYSGFPSTFLESLVCNTPIVTTDNGDRLDWIHNNVGLVTRFDEDQLSEGLFLLLQNDDLRKKFGKRGREYVFQHFTYEQSALEFEKIYKEVIFEDGQHT